MEPQINVLITGLEKAIEHEVRELLPRSRITAIHSHDEFQMQFGQLSTVDYRLLFCGPAIPELSAMELAQSLKCLHPKSSLIYLSSMDHTFAQKDLLKNGYSHSFFLPLDRERMQRRLRALEAKLRGIKSSEMAPVDLGTLVPGSTVDFDVMVLLPLNQKYIKLIKKGAEVRPEVLGRFASQEIKTVFISEDDQFSYQEYLRTHAPKENFKLPDRFQIMQDDLISLCHTIQSPDGPDFADGKKILGQATGIVNEILNRAAVNDVIQDVFRQTGQHQGDFYDQSLRISTYCALFSSILNVGKPEDLALAGLFHHLGMARLPAELWDKPIDKMTPEERAQYEKHPAYSLRAIQNKRLVVSEEVQDAILSHHERPDGSGFPKGLSGERIPGGAAILALASLFDDWTCVRPGKKSLTAREAAAKLYESGVCARPHLIKLQRALQKA